MIRDVESDYTMRCEKKLCIGLGMESLQSYEWEASIGVVWIASRIRSGK